MLLNDLGDTFKEREGSLQYDSFPVTLAIVTQTSAAAWALGCLYTQPQTSLGLPEQPY